jgi:hypothetical protein
MLLHACTIFLSAFLLFQVQPLIAKMILPWFGGSAAVWTACVLFFQLLLLFGYLYAHWSIRYLRPKAQTIVHLALLGASMLMLPAIPNPGWKPTGGEDPTLRIFGLLGATIGLPYFLLSTTGPLVQAWFVRERAAPGATPYRLYALSNLGSMLALLTYPILVEPYLATRMQGFGWSAGYMVFVLFCGFTSWRVRGSQAVPEQGGSATEPASQAPGIGLMLIWVGLAASASTLLLAVTNHLSQNVAAIPFLWVLPLALYLLSFILCFDGDGWYKRDWFLRLLALMLASMAYALYSGKDLPLYVTLPLFAVGLFVCCMVCHGELARLKPDPRYLTLFYLMVSIGGAIGGVFVGLIAPNVFNGYYELPLALIFCAALVLAALRRDLFRDANPNLLVSIGLSVGATTVAAVTAAFIGHDAATVFWYYGLALALVLTGCAVLVLVALRRDRFRGAKWSLGWLAALACVLALTVSIGYQVKKAQGTNRVAVRNFYGGLRVSDSGSGRDATRTLTHGTIIHGEQFLAPERRRQATTYYGPETGVGLAIRSLDPNTPRHIGVIGLGAGTLASYGRLGDRLRFYEINPLDIRLAHSQFSYLADCQAQLDIVLGDARLSLEREPDQNFDVLAVDAFSSDSIPVHLLTVEAFRLYFRHIKPEGALAVHVSNLYLNLEPIVELAAKALGKQTREIDTEDDADVTGVFAATWVLVTGNPQFFDKPEFKGPAPKLIAKNGLRMWTDDYSNLFRILK